MVQPTPLGVMTFCLKAERYSHGVRLTGFTKESFKLINYFLEGLSLKEPQRSQRGGMEMVLRKKYYGMTHDHREVYLHRNTFPDLMAYLKDRGYADTVKVVDVPVPEALDVHLELVDELTPRDYQESIMDELADTLYSRRVDLQTGKGKTKTALMACARLGKRLVVMIPPKYFGIWRKDIHETYKDISDRWVTVSGSGELQELIRQGVEGTLNYDIIIISMVTYRTYIEAFEKYGTEGCKEQGYLVPPPRFHDAIKAGVQINDEYQEDPGLSFRIDLYSNIQKQIFLSATPYTGNPFVTKMINVMAPPETCVTCPEWEKYIDCVALVYDDPKVKTGDYLVPYKNTYNHARYETQLLRKGQKRNKERLETYTRIIRKVTYGVYVKDRIPGQKLLILCATVNFINYLVKYLRKEFPDLVINSHVSGSNYTQLLKNDITVSTIKSSGTGVDIPNLREVILTQATDSEKDNVQIMGRLRKLKDWPEVTPRWCYFVCRQIPQSVRYMHRKQDYLQGKAKTHRVLQVGY